MTKDHVAARTANGRPIDPAAVECWVFDLDNTLYPAASNLFAQVSVRMTRFIMDRFALAEDDARALQRTLFRRHGTTLRGLMLDHGVEPQAFLDYVHDIDYAILAASAALDDALTRLPGRKIVFTNGSLRHAERVLERLAIARHMEAIYDIAAADWVPKPDPRPYADIVRRHGFDPARALMAEDSARNLAPAAALGMATLWIRTDRDWAVEGSDADHIHHVADDLAAWLTQTCATLPR